VYFNQIEFIIGNISMIFNIYILKNTQRKQFIIKIYIIKFENERKREREKTCSCTPTLS